MRKYITSLNLIIFIEIIIVILTSIGVFPREAVLFLTGILIFYFIFSSPSDSLMVFIISIPLFVALPITGTFDSMANWRILLSVLFLVWVVKTFSLRSGNILDGIRKFIFSLKKGLKSTLGLGIILFFGIGLMSLFQAQNAAVGVKKLLFLINIFLLFIIIKNIAKSKEIILKIIKAAALASVISLLVGYSQIISVFFVSLYDFWQWWAKNVIPVFYGKSLGELLSVSNTWFSYYPDASPTLRMFGIFPDSHSFALFGILSLPFFIALFIYCKNKKIITYHLSLITLLIILILLSILFTGSRGVWVSIIPVIALAIYFLIKKLDFQRVIAISLFSLFIFLALFPVSSFILSLTGNGGGDKGRIDSDLVFKRARSIVDLEETSNMSRLQIWRKSLNTIAIHPFFGIGAGNIPFALDQDISTAKKGASAHNLYLDITTEMGIFALVVVLFIFFDIFKTSWRVFRKSDDILFKAFAGVFSIYFIWVLGYNFFDVVLLNDKVLLLFMVATGLVYSMASLPTQEQVRNREL